MVLPEPFSTASPVLANYDYFDIAEGTGVVIFYGAEHEEGGVKGYFLSNIPTYSNSVMVRTNPTSTSYTKLKDNDFDVTFNTPKNINGKLRVALTLGSLITTATGYSYVIVKARHWDGTTETELGSGTTKTLTASGAVDSVPTNTEIDIDDVHFAAGETLRITIELWGKKSEAGTVGNMGYGCDPKNRKSVFKKDDDTSVMEVMVPFKFQ